MGHRHGVLRRGDMEESGPRLCGTWGVRNSRGSRRWALASMQVATNVCTTWRARWRRSSESARTKAEAINHKFDAGWRHETSSTEDDWANSSLGLRVVVGGGRREDYAVMLLDVKSACLSDEMGRDDKG